MYLIKEEKNLLYSAFNAVCAELSHNKIPAVYNLWLIRSKYSKFPKIFSSNFGQKKKNSTKPTWQKIKQLSVES
jgi:hypothetical protein